MEQFKAGQYVRQGRYKSFTPMPICRTWSVEDAELQRLLGQADRELGRLDMYSEHVPSIDLFTQMHVVKEATQSSKIEGTQTNMEEALLRREEIAPERRDDWQEVRNYIFALDTAIGKLASLPLSTRLLCETHRLLMQGVRGEKKCPGEFRRSQNWIGGASINDAVFVPPPHAELGRLMGDLENFLHDVERPFPELLKIAVAHYQFETIHPFLDGNGRVGRLMIPLYLMERGILKRPVFYLSDFFERNRTAYYDNLMAVREKNDLVRWLKFFLVGVIETAKNGIRTFDGILKLQKSVDERIGALGSRAANAQKVVNFMYRIPVVGATIVREVTGLSSPSSYKLIQSLADIGVLVEVSGAKWGKRYRFEEYMALFR